MRLASQVKLEYKPLSSLSKKGKYLREGGSSRSETYKDKLRVGGRPLQGGAAGRLGTFQRGTALLLFF